MLKISQLNVDLAGNRILRNVTATFERASTIGIVGRNGAGKTTLLRAIMGLIPVQSGQVFLDDIELTRLPGHARAAHQIGYSPEGRVIFPTMTVEENLRLPCDTQKLARADTDARLQRVLQVVPQLESMLRRSGAGLSGGQGKMVALGRALMVGTRALLLDEPYQGLAPKLAHDYTESLARLKAVQPDLCVIVTESNIKLLGDIPDQTWMIERGAMECLTTTQEAEQ
ncbi:ATP-binding cassette domain-containing protein [Pusillimonas sp. TS35]|uniref:ABC transporter ATP-binding protein n=1 Tax=Paracandidimonas lactea TaxID=2895524 RepID=UPI0013709360|nr:ATP-binding cassette domain-containing protein [Paracandidimonas lactea]MYN12334.1 ATP-binding cassette domain-containing protein [Pusillimonas sp. TS35]